MVSTSTRYISVAIGKGNVNEINEVFNVNLAIFIAISIITLLFALPIGVIYISKYVNYVGEIDIPIKIFIITIIGSIVSFISVPYNGLLIAKEKFSVFCYTDIIMHVIKLTITYLLIANFNNKLDIYTITIALTTALPTIIYYVYCNKKYKNEVQFRFSKNASLYKEVLTFSSWVAYGAIANVGKVQGAALIVNRFFNTIMNAALGIANSVNYMIQLFAQNITKPISPQISKSYSSGDTIRCETLVVWSAKLSFFSTFIIASPLLLETEYLLGLWLGNVSQEMILFTKLIVIDTLVNSLNSGISEIIFASGKIKLYQLLTSSVLFMSIIVAYIFLKQGAPAYTLLIVYIIFSFINFLCRQISLFITLKFKNILLFKEVYLPSIIVIVLWLPITLLKEFMPINKLLVSMFWLCILIFYIGLKKNERDLIINYFWRFVKK